ncbi:MAG: dipeptidase [Rhodothermales bacterium]|nr:dipeptidase [Rhodothermales bacterium]
MDLSKVVEFAGNNGDVFTAQLVNFLRIKSISTDPKFASNVHEAADWLVAELKRIGLTNVVANETAGHPVVTAELIGGSDRPTVLVYGHYDVQPPDPMDLWDSPPFEPDIKDGKIFARGACDDKGQVFMHLKAIESYLSTGNEVPVNVKLVIEGEEESGSEHLAAFLEANRKLLDADVVVISDTAMFGDGIPSITTGLRGLAYVQVELTGPNRDLHSGVYGGAVDNPANALARMIAALHDDNNRVTIDGFYDDVLELSEDERATFRDLPFDADEWKRSIGIEDVRTERGYNILEAITARPTLDVNGLWSGYQGDGAKTVLPATAAAKISMRIVPGQDPDTIAELARLHFVKHAPSTMKLEFHKLHGGKPVLVNTAMPAMKAAARAMHDVYNREPYFTREGGSIPVVADFKEILGLDSVLLGFGLNSDAIHSPNEHFGLDRFSQGIETIIRFMHHFGHPEDK